MQHYVYFDIAYLPLYYCIVFTRNHYTKSSLIKQHNKTNLEFSSKGKTLTHTFSKKFLFKF